MDAEAGTPAALWDADDVQPRQEDLAIAVQYMDTCVGDVYVTEWPERIEVQVGLGTGICTVVPQSGFVTYVLVDLAAPVRDRDVVTPGHVGLRRLLD